MFQEGEAANADRLMRSVVRRNPRYAGEQNASSTPPDLSANAVVSTGAAYIPAPRYRD